MTAPLRTAALVLALLLAAAGFWWIGRGAGGAPAFEPTGADGTARSGSTDPIAEYATFAAGLDPATATTEQLVEGLRALAGAVGVASGGEAPAMIDLRIAAEHIELNPDAGTTALVRSSLVSAADALRDDAAFRAAAEGIDPASPIADQRMAIAAALELAGVALGR